MISFQINTDKLHILKTKSNIEKKNLKNVGFVLAVYSLITRLKNKIYQISSCRLLFDCWVPRDVERFDSFLVIGSVRVLWKDLQSRVAILTGAVDAKALWFCICYTQRQCLVFK